MDEKTMVNDVLNCIKAELVNYQNMINESVSLEFRQTIQSIRDTSESFSYELFKIAQVKQYYKPATPANETEIQNVKTDLQID